MWIGRGFTSLDEWLKAIVDKQKDVFSRFCFPCQRYFDVYVGNIHLYSNEQVISLLRELLIPYTTVSAYEFLNFYKSISSDDDSYTVVKHASWLKLG